jgi:hypothetical protein
MKNFIKLYYPVIIIVFISMIIGGFIEREIIANRYNEQMENYDETYGSDESLSVKQQIIYGNCEDCY